MDPKLEDCVRRWAVRVESGHRSYTFAVFTFPLPVYRKQVLTSPAVLDWIDSRKVDEVYPWKEQPT